MAWNIRMFIHNKLSKVNFREDLSFKEPWSVSHWSQTDIMRLRKGQVGAQVKNKIKPF